MLLFGGEGAFLTLITSQCWSDNTLLIEFYSELKFKKI